MLLVILGIAGFNGVHTDICKNPDPYRILAQVVARCGKATKQKKAMVHHKCCTAVKHGWKVLLSVYQFHC